MDVWVVPRRHGDRLGAVAAQAGALPLYLPGAQDISRAEAGEIRALLKAAEPDIPPETLRSRMEYILSFLGTVAVDDTVALFHKDILVVGTVTGGCRYDAGLPEGFGNIRPVAWQPAIAVKSIPKALLPALRMESSTPMFQLEDKQAKTWLHAQLGHKPIKKRMRRIGAALVGLLMTLKLVEMCLQEWNAWGVMK